MVKRRAPKLIRRHTSPDAERRVPVLIGVGDLLLDSKNPRLSEELKDATQDKLLRVMVRDYDLFELGQSLADNGYFPEEPLVVVETKDHGKYTVVEGNRRLAALKLLLNPGLVREMKLYDWVKLGRSLKASLNRVPCIVYERREQVMPYLGFRHVSGVLKWEPAEKARFIKYMIDEHGKSFAEVAREIGSTSPTVRNNYASYNMLVEARDKFGIDVKEAEKNFGVLYRALSSPSIRKYIGLDLERAQKSLVKPIPPSKERQLRDFFVWTFGDSNTPPAMKDSRQITELGEILENAEATKALRVSRDLTYAYRILGGEERRLLDSLEKAAFYLDEALRDVHRHKASSKVAALVQRCLESMLEVAKHFRKLEALVRGS